MPSSRPPATPSGTATTIEASVTMALCPLAEDARGRGSSAPTSEREPPAAGVQRRSAPRSPITAIQDSGGRSCTAAEPCAAHEAGGEERWCAAGSGTSISAAMPRVSSREGEEAEGRVVDQPVHDGGQPQAAVDAASPASAAPGAARQGPAIGQTEPDAARPAASHDGQRAERDGDGRAAGGSRRLRQPARRRVDAVSSRRQPRHGLAVARSTRP